jgi:hypothetical protein
MKLNQLIAKPQLTKISLDDEATIKEFGEPIEWFIYDRQPLDSFLKLAGSTGTTSEQIVATMREMILDESGQPLLVDDNTLPTAVLLKVLNKMTEVLGK